MSGSYAFELPTDNAQIVDEILRLIPHDWGYMSGQLDAPAKLAKHGRVAEAGYTLARYPELSVTTLLDNAAADYRTTHEESQKILAYRRRAFFQLVGLRLLPKYVYFNSAGEERAEYGDIPFALARDIAREYVVAGYTGDLYLRSGENSYDGDSARCDIHLAAYKTHFPTPRKVTMTHQQAVEKLAELQSKGDLEGIEQLRQELVPQRPQHPPLVYLAWEMARGQEAIERLVSTCRQLELKEYDTEAASAYGHSFERFPSFTAVWDLVLQHAAELRANS